LGTNYINILNLRDYYKLPYPPVTPLASPPVIGIISFGGGIYGQPVSSGKYSGFWKCTDISGANGAPIQILVAPINGAINAPNADDGGATLENTVDVATVNAFYGMINQGRDAPVYTPPVIILYIAPSDDMEEVYKTFYTVLKNPVVCNGQSYIPSVVCCSWGAPEIAWTQKMPFPPSGLESEVDNDPNPAGIAIMNEINDLLADATRRGINICVASGTIKYPGADITGDNNINKDDVDFSKCQVMFPASSPYVTCVGGSSVFFPNGPTRNFNNPGEFAWSRGNGGVSNAFPIPDYQSNLPGSALVSANAFLASSRITASLAEEALGAANVDGEASNLSGVTLTASLSSLTKDEALAKAQLAYDNAKLAYERAKEAGGADAATLQLLLTMNLANTALTAAKDNAAMARIALVDAQDTVIKTVALETLMNEASVAFNVASSNSNAPVDACDDTTDLDVLARDAALLVLNEAVAQSAASVLAPNLVEGLTENVSESAMDAQNVLNDLVNPYDPFNPVTATALVPTNLAAIYRGSASYAAKDNLDKLVTGTQALIDDIVMSDSSGSVYASAVASQQAAVKDLSTSINIVASVVAYAAEAARLAKTVNDNTAVFISVSQSWSDARDKLNDASGNLNNFVKTVPAVEPSILNSAYAKFVSATDLLTAESVKLADATAANVRAAEKLKQATGLSIQQLLDANYSILFTDTDANAVFEAAKSDASGGDIAASTVETTAEYTLVARLFDLANVADENAAELKRCFNIYKDIADGAAGSEYVAKLEALRVALVRTQSSVNAVYVLLDQTLTNTAAPGFSASAASAAFETLVTKIDSLVGQVNSLIFSTPAANSSLNTLESSFNELYGESVTSSDGLIHDAVVLVITAVEAVTIGDVGTIGADVKDMLAKVLKAEGAILYSAYYDLYNSENNKAFTKVIADFTAGLSAEDAIYDEFKAMNIAAKKAHDLAVLALAAANLANARLSLLLNSFGNASELAIVVNQTMFNAAALSTAAANAMIDYNNLVYSYSSVTPALVDAAVRSQKAIHVAAISTNLATASASPAPVTPHMVATLQGLVLQAKASTQLALESNPTSVNLKTTLDLWNAAVTAGAAAVAGIAATVDPNPLTTEHEALRALFLAYANNEALNGPLGAIELAYTNGTSNGAFNFAVTSDMYLDGKAAYDFAITYFSIGLNGGNLKYVMTVANNAIVAAWNAAQASNVASSNTNRSAAQGLWETAANGIAQLLTAGLFTGENVPRPSELKDDVYGAYNKTTGLDASGNDDVTMTSSSDSLSTSPAYITAVAAYKAFMVAYHSYNMDFLENIEKASSNAAEDKNAAQVAIALAIASAARANAAAKKSAKDSSALATSTQAIQDQAALAAAEAAYSAADNVNMYRCVPDIAMHADVDDLPVVFRLNGGNVYVGGTSVAAAMFAGFLGVVQSHNPINYFMNPVLYNNFTYPSPLFYDISGTSELLNEENVTDRYKWVVSEKLDKMPNSLDPLIHGSYNPRVGLGSMRADALSAFLETPQLVTNMVTGPYPLSTEYVYVPTPPARLAVQTVRVYPGTTSDVYVFVSESSAYNTNVTWSCSSPYNATVTQTLEAYGPVDIRAEGSQDSVMAMVYRATVTGVVPVDPLAPVPVITIASTDGSNVFTTVNVSVLPAVQVTGVSISSLGETKNPANTVLFLGNTLQLIATVTPVLATNKHVYWWSSNMSIVNVDVNGLLTPLAPGQVTIKATSVNNNITASISVYVPTPMTGISASPTMITLNPNMLVYPLKNTQLIKALVTPANADYKQLTWSIASSQALALPAGTTNQYGMPLYYAGNNTVNAQVISLPTPNGIVLKRDSAGNIVDNTQDMVTAVSNGMAVINVSTANATDSVYGTYSANIVVNVVTPITNVTLEQTNMVIDLNPQSAVKSVNPSVNVQYGANNQNLNLPVYNAMLADRNVAQAYEVTATLFPAFPSNMNLIWTSSNPKVAIISNNTPPVLNTTPSDPNFNLFQVTEMITPLANGSTVIKVTTADGAKVAIVNVTVTTPVTNINLSPMPVTLNPGAQYALQATVLPTTASNAGLVWDTTNSAVATVDQNGLVTAVASGSCGISVSTVDGDYTAMATINVVTPLVGVSLVLNTPTPIHIGDMVQILVVMTPTTASNQQFTWTVTNGMNGSIFTNGPAQNGNIVYLDAAQAGSAVFTVTTADGNRQANLALTVVNY
jgi:uncharacterized protein YjdB